MLNLIIAFKKQSIKFQWTKKYFMGNYIFKKARKSKSENSNDDESANNNNKASSSSDSIKNKKDSKMAAPIIIQPTVKQTASVH